MIESKINRMQKDKGSRGDYLRAGSIYYMEVKLNVPLISMSALT